MDRSMVTLDGYRVTKTGANAVTGMRYDANQVTDGVTEVLSDGTAVVVEKV